MGVTVEGADLFDVRRQAGLGRDVDRSAMIEVNVDPRDRDFNRDAPPRHFRIRFAYGKESGSKAELTLEQLNAEIKRILGLHQKGLANYDKSVAKREADKKAQQLKAARKALTSLKRQVKILERR